MRRTVLILIACFSSAGLAGAQDCAIEPVAEAGTVTLARPLAGSVVREFGLQYDDVLKKKTEHTGVDLEAAEGEPVYAAHAGKVVEAGEKGDLGNYLGINHGGGLVTGYGHLASLAVAAGACVKAGQEIAAAGASGVTPGPQLHFEVIRDGTPVNPLDLLPQ